MMMIFNGIIEEVNMLPDQASADLSLDFFAVYDEMLLWRADMYIDEGNDDYNDVNPVFGDSWSINGGEQINIRPWTRFIDDANVYYHVAYSYGCVDSPIDFNLDMEDQMATCNYYIPYSWTTTLAPSWIWDNYYSGNHVTGNVYEHYEVPVPAIEDNIGPYQGYIDSENPDDEYTIIVDDLAGELFISLICDPDNSGPFCDFDLLITDPYGNETDCYSGPPDPVHESHTEYNQESGTWKFKVYRYTVECDYRLSGFVNYPAYTI